MMRVPYVIKEFTTLNEMLGIEAEISLKPNGEEDDWYDASTNTFTSKAMQAINDNTYVYPKVGYFVLGNGGLGGHCDPNDNSFMTFPKTHKAYDPAPFNMIPFVVRDVDDDLNAIERTRMCLRRYETIDGVEKVVYYGRRFNANRYIPTITKNQVKDGITHPKPFIPEKDNLPPTWQPMDPNHVNIASGDYLITNYVVNLLLDENEVQEIKNACNIKYGTEAKAWVTEIGICSGIDNDISTTSNGVPVVFKEAISMQVMLHLIVNVDFNYQITRLNSKLDFGVTTPLYKLKSNYVD